MSFGGILKQSTAVNVIIGPFVDSTNGDDEETGLTIAQADVRLSKNAGADAQKNDNTSAAHEGDGFYMCELDATDTNTVGQLTLWVHVAGALAVRHDYQIIEEAVYDALFGASALGYVANAPVNVAQFGGANLTATGGRPEVNVTHEEGVALGTPGPLPKRGITDFGTAQSASSTGVVLRSAAAFANDVLIGSTIYVFGSDQGYWQDRVITDNALTGDAVTVDAWTVTPTGTITYIIFAAPPVASNNGLATAAQLTTVEGKIDTIDTNVDAILVDTGTTLQGELDGIQADTEDIQSRLPAALVSGRMDSSVGAMANGTVTAAAIATGAIDADAIADNAIDAGAIAADAITNAKIADGAISAGKLASDTITAAKIAADAITDAKVASDVTIASVTGAVGSVTGNVGGNVAGSVGSVASGGITAASFGANAINAAKLDPDVTTELQSGLATASALATVDSLIDSILALLDDARTEPGQGAPPVNPDLATKIDYLYKAWRNKKDNNGTETKLYADDGSTVDHKQTTSESGGTVTKGEWATGA
jgi:hypothetical protein